MHFLVETEKIEQFSRKNEKSDFSGSKKQNNFVVMKKISRKWHKKLEKWTVSLKIDLFFFI